MREFPFHVTKTATVIMEVGEDKRCENKHSATRNGPEPPMNAWPLLGLKRPRLLKWGENNVL